MSGSLLDTDMRTLGRQLRAGLLWWCDELGGLVPAWLRPKARVLRDYALWTADEALERFGSGPPRTVLIDPRLCLCREVVVAGLSGQDLEQLIRLDADRILPIQPERLVLGIATDRARPGHATVAALPLERAERLGALIAAEGWSATRVAVAAPGTVATPGVDLSGPMQAAGLLPASGQGLRNWWILVGCLFVLNVALLIWRDTASVEQLETLVAEQEPAAAATRKIASRIAQLQSQAAYVARARNGAGPIEALETVSRVLPERTWISRYDGRGREVKLAGFRRPDADVVAAFRRSGRFAAIRSESGAADAEVPTGQPFALLLTLREGAR